MDRFVEGYIAAALCSLNAGLDFETYSISALSPEATARINEDCQKFQEQAGELLSSVIDEFKGSPMNYSLEKAGSDFWLTRNKDGSGYWSSPELREEDGAALAEIAYRFGSLDIYVGDDSLLYLS